MLYIVLPVHNRAPVTSRFLSDLDKQTHSDYQLVLVDDGCTDRTVDIARETLPQLLHVLTGDGQLWWAGALQMAYAYLLAKGLSNDDAVLLINDDVRIAADFLSCGLAALRAHPGSCIQAVGVDPANGQLDHGAMADTRRLSFRAARQGEAPNCLSTRGLLMSGKTFAASGGFRPRWLPHYLSDYEFTIRLARQGTRLLTDPSFTLVADHTTTGEQVFAGGSLRAYVTHSLSNRAMYNPKHWSALALLICPFWIAPIVAARIWAGFVLRGIKIALRHPVATH